MKYLLLAYGLGKELETSNKFTEEEMEEEMLLFANIVGCSIEDVEVYVLDDNYKYKDLYYQESMNYILKVFVPKGTPKKNMDIFSTYMKSNRDLLAIDYTMYERI